MSEFKKELEQDKDFVEEVSNRIYSDTDDIDEYMPEPEWIDRMTDIADKYITRFELAQKLVDKHLSSKHLQLNDNQQIVVEEKPKYIVKIGKLYLKEPLGDTSNFTILTTWDKKCAYPFSSFHMADIHAAKFEGIVEEEAI